MPQANILPPSHSPLTSTRLVPDEGTDQRVVVFNDLLRCEEGVQANRFLVQHGHTAAPIDPGGALLDTPSSLAIARFTPIQKPTWIVASHQDPRNIGAVDRWLGHTHAKVAFSRLCGRFLPHLVPHVLERPHGEDRHLQPPDEGGPIPMDGAELRALPPFLHPVGHVSFDDPARDIRLPGEVGSSLVRSREPDRPVIYRKAHRSRPEGFHRRHMASDRACRLWARLSRRLGPRMIVPQPRLPFAELAVIRGFPDWLAGLHCGAEVLPGSLYDATARASLATARSRAARKTSISPGVL